MAKLPRITQKIFAGNAPTNQVTTFGSIKAGTPVYSKNPADIMNSNFETGWSAAVEDDYAPYRQDRNSIDTVTTQQLGYIFQEGLPEWDSGTTYYNGSIVKVLDGTNLKVYRSIADSNTSALTDTTKWIVILNVTNAGVISAPTMNNPTMTGTVTIPTPSTSDSSTQAASTAYVQNNLTGAISTVKTANLTANRALFSNGSGKIAVSSVTSTELGYLSGVTGAIQTQFGAKQDSSTAVTHTASTAVGSGTNPVYVASNGTATASTNTVGSSILPVYLNAGTITACTTATVHTVVDTYVSGRSWYRVYDDGWVEQGGLSPSIGQDGNATITLLKPYANSNYGVVLTYKTSSVITTGAGGLSYNPSASSFVVYNGLDGSYTINWVAFGQGA